MCVYSNSTPISIEKYILEIISVNKLEIEKNVNLSFFLSTCKKYILSSPLKEHGWCCFIIGHIK